MAKIAENTVIVDGQEYKPGDVIPDFKSIKCVDTREPRKYQGLSADVSVLNDIIAKYASGGASCFMSDTGEYYEYDRKEKAWKLITNITERGFDSEKAYGALKHMLKNVTVSDEKIQSAVTNYLTVNPVLPGATTEQAQQIEQNRTDVASLKKETGSLKEDVSELKTSKSENRLYGKTMAILGDSMAKGHILKEEQTWAYKIANRNGMAYQKFAINGMFITTGHGDADANCLLEQAKKIDNNPDIIVIHMGTNDRKSKVELGNWTIGNTDTTNLFGALRVAFTYLAENFPLAQVMFITPYYYQEQTDYIGSIESACKYVGWHCKNNKQGGIWAWNDNVRKTLFLDQVHLNEVGQERVSYEYEGFMRTFM